MNGVGDIKSDNGISEDNKMKERVSYQEDFGEVRMRKGFIHNIHYLEN